MIQNHTLPKLRFGGIYLWKHMVFHSCHNQTTIPTQQPALKRIRGLVFFVEKLGSCFTEAWFCEGKNLIFNRIVQHTPWDLRNWQFLVGNDWLFRKMNFQRLKPKIPGKKKPVPNHRPLYGVFYTKKRGYCKRHTHQADGSAKSADDWGPIEKLMKQMGMDPVALALCRKSACGWWRFVCFFFAHKFWPCKKSIGNELEYLFGGNFWIFLGNRRRKRVLNKSWWLPQKKQRTWKGSGPRTSTSLV